MWILVSGRSRGGAPPPPYFKTKLRPEKNLGETCPPPPPKTVPSTDALCSIYGYKLCVASVRIPLCLLRREKAEDIARIRSELKEKGRVSLALLISLRC